MSPGKFMYRHAKRVVIGVIGGTVVLIGIALLVLPGPGILVIVVGLAILGTEFVWARRLMKKVKDGANAAGQKLGIVKDTSTAEQSMPMTPPPPEAAAKRPAPPSDSSSPRA